MYLRGVLTALMYGSVSQCAILITLENLMRCNVGDRLQLARCTHSGTKISFVLLTVVSPKPNLWVTRDVVMTP